MEGKNTVFLFSDTQIITESFLEDVTNILSSGEVMQNYSDEGGREGAGDGEVKGGAREQSIAAHNFFPSSRYPTSIHPRNLAKFEKLCAMN